MMQILVHKIGCGIAMAAICHATVFGPLPANAGVEDRSFELQRIELADRAEKILMSRGICRSKSECRFQQHLFVSPANAGLSIQIFAVNDRLVIAQIVRECADQFFQLGSRANIYVDVYEVTKQTQLAEPFWKAGKASTTIKFVRP